MRCGGLADGGAEGRFDDDVFVVGANFLENLGGPVGIEMVDQRCIMRPSLEGTLADSFKVWVWMESSLLVLSGLMR
jgi:hypothetical protein